MPSGHKLVVPASLDMERGRIRIFIALSAFPLVGTEMQLKEIEHLKQFIHANFRVHLSFLNDSLN